MDELRLPPQSIEAEQSVLGGLLLDNSALDRIADILGEQDFYRNAHKLIYRQMERLICDNHAADVVTVAHGLGESLEAAGGREYIDSLAVNSPSATNIRRYAEIVRERAMRRRLVILCMETQEALFGSDATTELMAKHESGLYALSQRHSASGGREISVILTEVIEGIDARCKSDNDSGIDGIATGFTDLDKMTSGFQPGDLIVIAGRPSMGKTALAMNIVEHVALKDQRAAAVFSLEMSDRQLVQRMLGSVARVNQHAMRAGRLSDDDWGRMSSGIGKLNESQIIIEETSYLNATELRSRARRIARQHSNLGLIVVDYLQLMATPGKGSRNDEVGDITRAMKTLAKELNVPVVALSQLNRGLEQRTSKRPVMSDLRDSGGIEQDADVIIALYREEVYDADTLNKGSAEAIVLKQRNGPVGMVRLTFRADITRFENFAGEYVKKERKSRSRAFQEPQRERADING